MKMVGANVSAMEEQVTQAEGELGTLPSAFKKILRTMTVPGFLNVRAPSHTCYVLALHYQSVAPIGVTALLEEEA